MDRHRRTPARARPPAPGGGPNPCDDPGDGSVRRAALGASGSAPPASRRVRRSAPHPRAPPEPGPHSGGDRTSIPAIPQLGGSTARSRDGAPGGDPAAGDRRQDSGSLRAEGSGRGGPRQSRSRMPSGKSDGSGAALDARHREDPSPLPARFRRGASPDTGEPTARPGGRTGHRGRPQDDERPGPSRGRPGPGSHPGGTAAGRPPGAGPGSHPGRSGSGIEPAYRAGLERDPEAGSRAGISLEPDNEPEWRRR